MFCFPRILSPSAPHLALFSGQLQLLTPSTAGPMFLRQVSSEDEWFRVQESWLRVLITQMLSGPVSSAANWPLYWHHALTLCDFCAPPPVVFCFINVRLPPSVQKGYVHGERAGSFLELEKV